MLCDDFVPKEVCYLLPPFPTNVLMPCLWGKILAIKTRNGRKFGGIRILGVFRVFRLDFENVYYIEIVQILCFKKKEFRF